MPTLKLAEPAAPAVRTTGAKSTVNDGFDGALGYGSGNDVLPLGTMMGRFVGVRSVDVGDAPTVPMAASTPPTWSQ